MQASEIDSAVRTAAFRHLDTLRAMHGEALPRTLLLAGFRFQGTRVPLLSPRGIFKPQLLDLPLSITTVPPSTRKPRPYDDQWSSDGTILYRYFGKDPGHPDNVGLRTLCSRRVPLIYFHGLVEGLYAAAYPAFIVGDDPATLTARVEVDDVRTPSDIVLPEDEGGEARRRYVTATVQRRLHQQAFRARVLQAYRNTCAICRLRHQELLEAAHILPDTDPRGAPQVSNGLALCTLHHTAFDRQVLGIRPDLAVEIRTDVMKEKDGPMLLHGLQSFHNVRITIPREASQQPRREFLEERYAIFRKAS